MTPEILSQLVSDNSINISDYNAVIVRRKVDNTLSFATICIKPHWNQEGIMFTSGTWDATKFPIDSADLGVFCKYIKERNPEDDIDIILLLKRYDGTHENWENEKVRGNYGKTGVFKDKVLVESQN